MKLSFKSDNNNNHNFWLCICIELFIIKIYGCVRVISN